MKNTLIEIKNLHKEFKVNSKILVAINDLTFNINEGENLALIGSNGAGKTTTVEILIGLSKQDSGTIKYNLGVEEKNKHEQIGIQFQSSSYPPGIKVKRVIKFIIDAYNASITKDELEQMIDVFGIRDFYNQEASGLSGGQQQRLNIILALLHKPKVVFLDELSTGLDITIRTEIKKFIKEFTTKHKITIVIISHDAAEIEYLADRIVIMNKGNIVIDRMIKDVKSKEKSFEEFITKYITH